MGAPLPGSAYFLEHICRKTQPGSLYLPGYSTATAFARRGRGAFCGADLRRLVSGSASSSRNPIIEALSRVQGARGTSRSSSSSSGDSS